MDTGSSFSLLPHKSRPPPTGPHLRAVDGTRIKSGGGGAEDSLHVAFRADSGSRRWFKLKQPGKSGSLCKQNFPVSVSSFLLHHPPSHGVKHQEVITHHQPPDGKPNLA
jgi:hypothetical protein